MPYQTPTDPKPLITPVVAVIVVAISIAEGGYSTELRAAAAVLSWVAVLAGLLFGVLPRSRTPAAALASGSALAGLALLTGLSVAWAGSDGAVIDEVVRVSLYLGLFTLVVSAAREGEARAWLLGLAIGIAVVGFVAILGRLISDLPGGDEEITELLPAARGRLSYPIGYWNAIAALLGLGVVLMTWLGASARGIVGRSAATALIPMLVLGMYLASSRGGYVAMGVGLLVLIAVGPPRSRLLSSAVLGAVGSALAIALASGLTELLDVTASTEAENEGFELLGATVACVVFTGAMRAVLDGPISRLQISRRSGWIAVAVCAVVAVGVAIASDPGARFDEFKTIPAEAEDADDVNLVGSHLSSVSGSGRWQFWGEALDAYSSQPVRGIGAGGYEAYWNEHAPITQVAKQAHSLYLELLAELGPLALILVLAFLLIGPVRGVAARHRFEGGEAAAAVALVASGAASAAIDWTWEVPAVFGVVVVALALLAGPAFSVLERDREEASAYPAAGRFGWGIAVILIGWVSLFIAADSLLTERRLDASRAAVGDEELERAADEARAAIALQPWAAEPRLQLALVQESAGELEAADENVERAIERAEDDWSLWLVSARIATLDGRIPDARADLEQARRLNPRAPLFAEISAPEGGQ